MRKCPIDGTSCANLECIHGCAGIDIHVEAVTVIRTTMKRRAVVSLVAGGSTSSGRPTHDSGRSCDGAPGCGCAACSEQGIRALASG